MKQARHQRRRNGFSILDLLVVIVVIAAMLAIQIPSDAAARRTARRMQNSTQLRGIHQGLVTHANSNKEFFAGLDSKGGIIKDGAKTTGKSGNGDTVQARFWMLMDGDYFTPEYAVSPSEVHNVTPYNPNREQPLKWDKNTKNYSYAMLGIHGDKKSPLTIADESKFRAAEWQQTLSTQAIVLSDRNTGSDATRNVQSIHTDRRGEWQGSVLWNDNHVGFENAHDRFATKYGNAKLNADDFNNGIDNIYLSNETSAKIKGQSMHADALMIITGNQTVQIGE